MESLKHQTWLTTIRFQREADFTHGEGTPTMLRLTHVKLETGASDEGQTGFTNVLNTKVLHFNQHG